MINLFIRSIILYLLVFVVIRMTGKRQLRDLQPFDLIVTLLLAELASEPAADASIPLLYGILPILALFLVQMGVSFLSLKSQGFRHILCGTPLLLIARGVVNEQALRDARYSLNDLMEQLRNDGVFDITEVAYAVLETNGELSILRKGISQTPSYGAMSLPPPDDRPPFMLIQDGKVRQDTLGEAGHDLPWLQAQLARIGAARPDQVFYAFLMGDTLHLQCKAKYGAGVFSANVKDGQP